MKPINYEQQTKHHLTELVNCTVDHAHKMIALCAQETDDFSAFVSEFEPFTDPAYAGAFPDEIAHAEALRLIMKRFEFQSVSLETEKLLAWGVEETMH